MLKNVEVRKVLSQIIREKITEVVNVKASEGEIVSAIHQEVIDLDLVSGVDLLNELLLNLVHVEINRRMRALPDPPEQIGLFAKLQAKEQFVRHEDEKVGPMEYAKKEQVIKRREDQFLNVRHAHNAFEREEKVRERVLPVMAANDITFGEACRQIGLF